MIEIDREDILGKVTWPDDGPTATLLVDGSWSVPDAEWMEASLKSFYSDAYEGPSAGPFGVEILDRLAKKVGGTAHVEPRDDPAAPGDIVY